MPFFEISSLGWRDIVDVALVTLLLYQTILLIRGTRAVAAIFGLLGLVIMHFISGLAGFSTINWLLEGALNYIVLIVIIVFQQDIRAALTTMGSRQKMFFSRKRFSGSSMLDEVCESVKLLANGKIGALIVIERAVPLGDLMERGVRINARPAKELITTLFWYGSPLHDGAVIMNDNEIIAAGCILPLSAGDLGKSDYGTRHRAGIGITEGSDAVAVIVSEERGSIRIARNGHLSGNIEPDRLKTTLGTILEKH